MKVTRKLNGRDDVGLGEPLSRPRALVDDGKPPPDVAVELKWGKDIDEDMMCIALESSAGSLRR